MAIEKVKEYLKQYNLAERIQEFEVSSATVELAAEALGCEPAWIAKSMSFLVGDRAILVVTAGDRKIENPKFKAQFGCKAKMLNPDQVVDMVGHAIGGVCPFATNPGVKVYLDESLKRFEKVYPACGSSNSAIGLTIDELVEASGMDAWVDVCKPSITQVDNVSKS